MATSVAPDVINTGQLTTLTITGVGFVAPIAINARRSHLPFETPLTNITIINSTTITATLPAMADEGLYDLL
jgi:IPT/TIG domain-containing protein